ncbi:MAG: tetratricopeptide repeat protein [Sandaracinaceae bacterium]|nr:tetratricopeptide repeat protein [Sandaracinaceae bacterium]
MSAPHAYPAAARGYRQDLDDDDDDDPTRIVSRAMLDEVIRLDHRVDLLELPGAATGLYDAVPVADDAPGWGPRERPAELGKTTFWERTALTSRREPPREAPRARAAIPSEPAPAARPAPRRRRHGPIIGAIGGAIGVFVGVGVGLVATQMPHASERVATEPPSAVHAEPAPAVPSAAAPAAASAPAVAASAVEASAPAHVEPEPEVPAVAEAPAEAEAPPEPTAIELLAQVEDALRDADPESAAALLARARAAGVDRLAADRLDAALSVLRGDGAPAIPRLRSLAEQHRDAAVWSALGRTLEQAERDTEAQQAFEAAIALDPQSVDAHVGLASIAARAAAIGAAQRHLRIAEEAAHAMGARDPVRDARLRVAAGMIQLEHGRLSEAAEEAARARLSDPRSAEASLLLARVALARRHDATPHLRAAVTGRAPPPVALGLLAPRVRSDEACELASRYLDRAPEGWDARAMRRIRSRCF